MWLLGPLMLAVLASDRRMYRETEKLKELYTRLGLGDYLYIGMPFHGGRIVVAFDDGTRLVELVSQDDFAVAGTSLRNFHVGGDTHGREEQRDGDGLLWERKNKRMSVVLVYVDAQYIPQAHLTINRQRPMFSDEGPGKLTVLSYGSPNFKYRDRFDERELAYGKIPEELQDKILSVWLDLQPHLEEGPEELAAAVFGEEHNANKYVSIRKRWEYNHSSLSAFSDNDEYNRTYYEWRHLDEKSTLDYDEEEDKNLLDMVMQEQEEAFRDDGVSLVDHIHDLGIVSFTEQRPFFKTLHGKLTGSQQASTLRWAWDVSLPGTAYALMGQPDFTLELRMGRPNAAWLRKHRIRDPKDSFSSTVKLPKPLLTWLLRDPTGKVVAEEPYESGLFDLLEAHTPMRDLLAEQIQSLSEDAHVVAEDTQRRWIVPIEELIRPLKAPALPWDDE